MTLAAKRRTLVDLFCLFLVAATIALMVGHELNYSWQRGNQLSEIADAYGEADVIHAADGYTTLGLTSHWGLPDVSFGTMFDRSGGKYDPNLCARPVDCIYLHNPPGNPLTIGLLMKLVGADKLFIFRAFAILIGALALSFLALAMVRTQGAKRAAFVYACMYMIPMTSNMMHSICYHGYLLAFFFIELAILLFAFDRPGPLRRREMAGLAGICALSSAYGYEWIFPMILLGVPVWLALADLRDRIQRRKLAQVTVILFASFGIVQVLHILQVAAYLGSLRAALVDLAARGAIRTGYEDVKHIFALPGFLGVWANYWFDHVSRKQFMDFNFAATMAFVVFALLQRTPVRFTLSGHDYEWRPRRSYIWSLAAMFVAATLWITVMQAHAIVHTHFIPRQYLSALIFAALLFARSFHAVEPSGDTSPPVEGPAPTVSG